MMKRLLLCTAAVLFFTGVAMSGQDAKTMSWSGVVTDNMCGAKGAKADMAACTKKCVSEHGAKLALYDTANKKVYILDPQEKATGHEGHSVTVKGTLDGDTIHVESIDMNKVQPSM